MNRRAFLKSVGRSSVLFAFAALGVVGVRSGKIKQRGEDGCTLTSTCADCKLLADCRKAEAVSAREQKGDAVAGQAVEPQL